MSRLLEARTPEQWRWARTLVEEYAASLDFALDFQDFEQELRTLEAVYGPPDGCMLLAFEEDAVAGCVALRRLSEGIGEMKRLYVRPGHRGRSVGRALVEAIIERARGLGYDRMRLDTVPAMEAARRLYAAAGFREIDAYRHNPIPGATYMELSL